jgi:hypothetical protein
MAETILPNGPATTPELPLTLRVGGDLGVVEFVRRLHTGGLELRNAEDGSYAVIVRAEREPAENAIGEHIEKQRRQLNKAAAVLLAVIYSLDRGLENEQAGDAASVALDLIEAAVAQLDSVTLSQGGRS